MACTNVCAKIINDIEYSCDIKPIGGLEQTVKLINRCDIELTDWTLSRSLTNSACTHSIAFSGEDAGDLNSVKIEGVPGKRLLNATFASSNTDFGNYYTHTLSLFAQGLSEEVLCTIKAFGEGAEVVAFVEQRFKGSGNEDAYLVYGWDQGLKLADFTFDHNENNGGAIIPLSSLDPDLEPFPPMRLFMTSYALTKTFFDSL